MIKYCVVTGSRAEYGLLWPLMDAIRKEKQMQLQLLVTGMHLSPEFGLTYKEIDKDGFAIDEKIEMLLSGDTSSAITKSMGLGLIGYADALERLQPDWLIVLGDRFESFMAVTAAYVRKIPVIHISGGETTLGAVDEAFRHSITKMSYLHFTSLEEYKKRVIQLGEEPERVFNVGALGLDNIERLDLLSKKQLEKTLGLKADNPYALITFHPVTLEKATAAECFQDLLNALDGFKDMQFVFTLPNADEGGRVIIKMIESYQNSNTKRVHVFTSLGQVKYLSLMSYASLAIGNSSSGIVESPSFGLPVVNIGDRQKGRVKAGNIIDSADNTESIKQAIKKALSPAFVAKCGKVTNPYGDGQAAQKIIKVLRKFNTIKSVKKRFYDLP